MYLSRLFLNPRSAPVRRDIANPYELHRTVQRAFTGHSPAEDRVLFRLEAQPRTAIPLLLVQSRLLPNWSLVADHQPDYLLPLESCPGETAENPSVKQFTLTLRAGQTLAFRLRANPTVKKDREGRKQGNRVGLYREEEQIAWLQRKLQAAGAELLSTRLDQDSEIQGVQKHPAQVNRLTFLAVQFDGLLRVIDPQAFTGAVENGIGSAKGLGFGLLSLAPAPA